MRLIVGCIGKLKRGPEAELVARYGERCTQVGRSLSLTGPEVFEIPENPEKDGYHRLTNEGYRLREKLPDKVRTIAFDEHGKSFSSRNFADYIRKCRDSGVSDLAFLIGGPDGLSNSLREDADHVLSFGKLTMPHQIVRILVMEQLYRATTILTNHPYHRD